MTPATCRRWKPTDAAPPGRAQSLGKGSDASGSRSRATMDLAFGYHHFSHTHSQLLGAGTLGGQDAKSMVQGNKKDAS